MVWYLSNLCDLFWSVRCCKVIKTLLLAALYEQLFFITVFLGVWVKVTHMLWELLMVHYLRRWLFQEIFLRRRFNMRRCSLLFLRWDRFCNFISLEIFIFLIFLVIVKWKLVTIFVNTFFVHFRNGLDILYSAWGPLLLMLTLHQVVMLSTSLRRIATSL